MVIYSGQQCWQLWVLLELNAWIIAVTVIYKTVSVGSLLFSHCNYYLSSLSLSSVPPELMLNTMCFSQIIWNNKCLVFMYWRATFTEQNHFTLNLKRKYIVWRIYRCWIVVYSILCWHFLMMRSTTQYVYCIIVTCVQYLYCSKTGVSIKKPPPSFIFMRSERCIGNFRAGFGSIKEWCRFPYRESIFTMSNQKQKVMEVSVLLINEEWGHQLNDIMKTSGWKMISLFCNWLVSWEK